MQIRPMQVNDLEQLPDIDGTIESANYLHLEQAGSGLGVSWRLEERPLREKRIDPNPIDDEQRFAIKQIVIGAEEGLAMLAEHDDAAVAIMVVQPDPARGLLRIVDLRVDYDFRRQGLGTALLYQVIQAARERELRAVAATTLTNNLPAAQLLLKCGFDLAGVDARRQTNHDLVKEAVSLFWYAALD